MRFLRNKFVVRFFSAFGILIFSNCIFYPNISYALTTGPHQPEYTSYEEAGAKDMVNLLTGDFTLTMPLLSVPVGSDGSFAVPLSYHGGVGPETESSWIGLGWNINVGSITRSINGFPDDASGTETQTVTVKDLTGRRGWNANFLGNSLGWDSHVGHYGVLNLGFGTYAGYNDSGINSVGLGGPTWNAGKVGFSGEEFYITAVQVLQAVATYGSSSAGNIGLSIAVQKAVGLAIDAGITDDYSPTAPTAGLWKYESDTDKKLFHTEYWIWLDQTRVEEMYGTLYLDKAETVDYSSQHWTPAKLFVNNSEQALKRFKYGSETINKGAASDISIDLSSSSASTYWDNVTPSTLAYDDFNVKGPGISGNIKPYRLEIGSVSTPREMKTQHIRTSPIPFLDYGAKKVPFVYEGSNSNRYFHHVGGNSSVTAPNFNFGIDGFASWSPAIIRYDLNDIIFSNERIRSDVSTIKKLPQGHHIDWLTNGEIKNATSGFSNTSYIDYFSGQSRIEFRTVHPFGGRASYYSQSDHFSDGIVTLSSTGNFVPGDLVDVNLMIYNSSNLEAMVDSHIYVATVEQVNTGSIQISLPPGADYLGKTVSIEVVSRKSNKADNSIGGFVITSADGMNYHYSIPVYDYDFKTETIDKNDSNKKSVITRSAPFANTWLLTAITGPDFVDRGGSSNSGNGIIDENDWGYWVKLNYGKHTSGHKWRIPFNGYKLDETDKYKIYAQGFKEKYYLNSIESRSHVALFIKNSRVDALDVNMQQSLRLSEIALITKETYEQLVDPTGSYQLPSCSGVINEMYTVEDFNGNKGALLQSSALRRIIFGNNNYSLCPGTLNSSSGKLTLKSLSILGRNNSKVFPDYKFEYNNNPSYNLHKWDGWGIYSASANSAGNSHKASPNDSDGAAWSLNKIITPEGSNIIVDYERDTYSSISGQAVTGPPMGYSSGNYLEESTDLYSIPTTAFTETLTEGDKIKLSGYVTYHCPTFTNAKSYYGDFTVQNVLSDKIYLSEPYVSLTGCSNETITVESNFGTLHKKQKKGGNIRVSSIELRDPNGQSYKTRYLYNNEDGLSSGVVAQEPEYIKSGTDPAFYKYLNYPFTNVLYGRVTVLTGKLINDSDFNNKQVFEFEMPNSNQYNVASTKIRDKELLASIPCEVIIGHPGSCRDYMTIIKHEIQNKTSRIGKLKTVKTYDKAGAIINEQIYTYTDSLLNNGVNNYQGFFSEGNLMFEMTFNGAQRYHKGQRTTVLNYPYTLKKITSIKDGLVSVTENNSWDLLTGIVTEQQSTSPMGIKVKSVTDLAYKISAYSEFGSKAENSSNKNMMAQVAANYTYRLNNSGAETGLIGASAIVWRKDWQNYRVLDGSNNYINDDDLIAGEEAKAVWRQAGNYLWQGDYSRLNPDGTHIFNASDKFNFSEIASNSKWQGTSTLERFNHYSTLMEAKNMNNIYASSKLSYNDRLLMATASNAKYEEIAFCSAEDPVNASGYFGGEVAKGAGTLVTSAAHTGRSSVSVTAGKSFIFKTKGLGTNKKYKACVWTTETHGRLYYSLNNQTDVLSSAPSNQKKVGSWYYLEFEIPIGSNFESLEVGVKSSTGAAALFDDFRFQPSDAVMSCFVYAPDSKALEYTLGNDNLYTKYQYNDRGLLTKTYRESFKYGEKLVTETKDDYRRFHVDQ